MFLGSEGIVCELTSSRATCNQKANNVTKLDESTVSRRDAGGMHACVCERERGREEGEEGTGEMMPQSFWYEARCPSYWKNYLYAIWIGKSSVTRIFNYLEVLPIQETHLW